VSSNLQCLRPPGRLLTSVVATICISHISQVGGGGGRGGLSLRSQPPTGSLRSPSGTSMGRTAGAGGTSGLAEKRPWDA